MAITPTIDAGWPVSTGIINNPATSISVSTPAGAGGNRLLIAVVREVQGANSPISVSGLGLTWTNVLQANYSTYVNASIWATWAASSVPSGSVTVQLSSGSTNAKNMAVTVYSLVNAKSGASNILASFGSSASDVSSGSSQITISSTTFDSMVLGAIAWGFNSDLAGMPDTNIDHEALDNSTGSYVAAFRYTSLTGGSVTVGGSLTTGVNARALIAIEILGAVSAAETFLGGAAIPGTKTFVLTIPAGGTEAQFVTDADMNFIWNALDELRDAVNNGGLGGSMGQIATLITEATVTIPSSGTWIQLDDGNAGRPAKLSSRFKVRVVNNSGTERILIFRGTSTTGVNASECEAIEPQKGVWEDVVGTGLSLYVQSAGVSTTVRVIQYA